LAFFLSYWFVPKPISVFLDPERRKKKKKRRKRKIDYTALLNEPIVPDVQCPHTRRIQDASACSQCIGVVPSVVQRNPTVDWWAEDAVDDLQIDIDLNSIISDDD
jgi:hypothetical protein